MQEFTSDPKRAIKVFLNPGICPAHPDQVLKFYCYTCDHTICVECALLDHPRGEHKFDSISKVIVEEKEEVLKTAAVLEPMRDKVCEAMNRVAASKDDITDNHQVNVKQVNSLFDELHQILEQQREEMLKKLETFKNTSHKSLDIQNSDLAFLESKLKSCREFVSNLMDNGNANEILSFKRQIADRVTKLTSLLEQAPLQPVCTADSTVWCIDRTKFVTMCQSVCHLLCSPHPPNCVVDKPMRHYIDDEGKVVNAVSVTVSLQDRHGNAVVGQGEHLEAISPEVTHVTVKEQDNGRGVYKITYQPISIEADVVMIKWNGHDIIQCNVPGLLRDYTDLKVVRLVEMKSEDYKELEDEEKSDSLPIVQEEILVPIEADVLSEQGLVSDLEGDVQEEVALPIEVDIHIEQVGDQSDDKTNDEEGEQESNTTSKNSIASEEKEEIAEDDNNLKTITKYGADGVEFGKVFSLCNGPNDELIVADSDNDKLIVFDKHLQYSHTIGESGENEGQLYYPTGVACDTAGQLYVADYDNNRVPVFTLKGVFVTTIGNKGNGDGEFNGPTRLVLSSTGLLFVCDTGNKRVQVFDTQHNYQFQYSFGHGKVVVDLTLNASEDKLFGIYGACILVFTPQGQFLHSIALDPYSDVLPFSICCTLDGHLLLGNCFSSNFLSVYHEDGTQVCGHGGGNIQYEIAHDLIRNEFMLNSTYAVHSTRNGQIMVFCENSTNDLVFDTDRGVLLL